MITRLLHTRYRVHDLEKTVSFYRDVLGLEDIHQYLNVPHREPEIDWLRTEGSKDKKKAVFLSEYGVGSALDLPTLVR